MPPQTPITRMETVIPVSSNRNQYGDLLFQDASGKEYKLGNKRAGFFPIVEHNYGRQIKLGYAVYNNKEYITTVALANVTAPAPSQATSQNKVPVRPNPSKDTTPAISSPEKG